MSDPSNRETDRHSNWKPLEIAAIVIAFLVNVAAGIVLLLWRMWKHFGSPRSWADVGRVAKSMGIGFDRPLREAEQNTAFEDYRRETLERLERERRDLDDEEREFDLFLRDLRRAKDREAFDRFMAARAGSTP